MLHTFQCCYRSTCYCTEFKTRSKLRTKKIHQNHVARIVAPGVVIEHNIGIPKPLQDLCHFCRFKVSRTAAQLLSTILQKSSNLGRAMAANRFGRHEFQGVCERSKKIVALINDCIFSCRYDYDIL